MAHNILLNEKQTVKSSANILTYINKLYKLSQTLQKNYISTLKSENRVKLLNLIYEDIKKIINYLNSSNSNKKELFNTLDILNNIERLEVFDRVNVSCSQNFKQDIIANKESIEAAILLIILLQIDEHKLKKADIYLEVEKNRNCISIQTVNYLDYNSFQKEIIQGSKLYEYNKKEKKFYGLYLTLLKKIVNKSGGKFHIYDKHNSKYKIAVSIPIEFNQQAANKASLLNDLNKKVLIYTNSKYTATKIKEFLSEHPFFVDIKLKAKLETKYPNFKDYDLIVVDNAIINKKIVSLLKEAKESNINILILADKDKKDNEILNLADITVNKPFNYNELTFNIINFYSRQEESKKAAIKQTALKKDTKPKVLIADSNSANLKLLEYLFNKEGAEVLSAKSAKELIEKLEQNGANLVIVDSILPDKSAYEVAKYIRAKKRYRNLPIVIHSAFSFDKHSLSDIFHYGFDAYLPKPFSHSEIEKLAKLYLHKAKSQEELKNKKRFFALYKDIDNLIKKYAKEHKVNSLIKLFNNLKNELNQIDNTKLIPYIDIITQQLKETNYIDTVLIDKFIKGFRDLITELEKEFNKKSSL